MSPTQHQFARGTQQGRASALQPDVDPAAVFSDIAALAANLEDLVRDAMNNEDLDLMASAAALCQHIGWLADRAAMAHGSQGFRGGADQWFLTPAAATALQSAERALAMGGAS